MTTREAFGGTALKPVAPKTMQSAFRHMLSAQSPLPASLLFAKVDWGKWMHEMGASLSILQDHAIDEVAVGSSAGGAAMASAYQGLSKEQIQSRIQDVVHKAALEVLGLDELDTNAPLMESGLDSLSAVDFRNQVAQAVPGVKLPNTLMFDYPTTDAIAMFAATQLAPSVSAPARMQALPAPTGAVGGPSGVLSTACHFPGGGSSPENYWEALSSQKDGVIQIPFERWEVDEYYSPNQGEPGKMYVRHAGFVVGAELFDAGFFGISAAEAKTMTRSSVLSWRCVIKHSTEVA
jgi:hypothetical protein